MAADRRRAFTCLLLLFSHYNSLGSKILCSPSIMIVGIMAADRRRVFAFLLLLFFHYNSLGSKILCSLHGNYN